MRFNLMKAIPQVLLTYIEGLKVHNVPKVAVTVADDVRFITPADRVNKERFLNFLRALYAAFPDWTFSQYVLQAQRLSRPRDR